MVCNLGFLKFVDHEQLVILNLGMFSHNKDNNNLTSLRGLEKCALRSL